jgi:serpin B
MMHMDEAFPYHQDDLFDAAGLSLMNGATLWILLPKDNVTPAALCSSEAVITWLKSPSYEQEDLVLSVPQFDISDHVPLIDVMKGLGAGDIFDSDLADFSGLSDDISGCFVTRFEQTLRIRLSEGGIEAAAYAEAVIISAAAPEDAVSFTADRPFLFALRDFDGTILFAGIVNDPSR